MITARSCSGRKRRNWTAVLLLVLVLSGASRAHRVDEYLQAARISVGLNRIDLGMDLTPGTEVAGQVVPLLRPDPHGAVSAEHSAAYGRAVLRDLSLRLDNKRRTLSLVEIAVPPRAQMEAGEGTIHLSAKASIPKLETGAHELVFRNDHLPKISVYLANALVPRNSAIRIVRQSRDELQRECHIVFELKNAEAGASPK